MGQRSGPWVEIDARAADGELGPTAVVGGIPLVVRPLRQAARLGWNGARVIAADAGGVEEVGRALARYPVPPALAVEVVTAAEASAAPLGAGAPVVRLDARAIYHRDALVAAPAIAPSPLCQVRTRADARRAERVLYAQIRKSVDGDGFFAHHLIRPITVPLSRALLGTRVSPNQVTFVALLCGLGAAACAAAGGAGAAAVAGALYWLGNAFDCVDGDLARLRLQSSKLGEWLDSMTDEISTFSLLAGLGVGLWREGAGAGWLAVGIGGSAIGAVTVASLYRDLHRLGLPIDSAQYPWFFTRTAAVEPATAPARAGLLARLGYAAGFLIRRDANVTGVTLMLLLDARRLATALVAAGAVAGALVTIAHHVVMAHRRRRGSAR